MAFKSIYDKRFLLKRNLVVKTCPMPNTERGSGRVSSLLLAREKKTAPEAVISNVVGMTKMGPTADRPVLAPQREKRTRKWPVRGMGSA
ncbi:hypothetical protein SJ05684_c18930 [Sinorhizobium sojae CCBAU 05684]|uniref:Uncharacterized protein n=1 Tax=Sinorhizobium sojae CCBAU 05684 TaxID=716928 RepID=A0A249PC38_9HYPH|nr:hypothetical protein [Sinorhizobium sojae]ASY63335.1 hypothetical protein SJ05684_c18930 [Sinorhizobium sojae CCBAU 05684]